MVVVSHPARAARKDFVEVLDCSSQRANRPQNENEVILDKTDGLDWPAFCKCDWSSVRSGLPHLPSLC
jgi:hypothetical protein